MLYLHYTLMEIPISNTFLVRVQKTITSGTDFKIFVMKEPSLANRIISYIVRFKMFQKYPITGIGYKNTEYHAADIFAKQEILTYESSEKLKNLKNGKMGMNGAIFWDTLSDTGIIGILLYYLFVFSLIQVLNKLIKNIPNGIVQKFMFGLKNSYLCLICLSFYDIRPNFIYFWFLYGLTTCCILYKKQLDKCMRRV